MEFVRTSGAWAYQHYRVIGLAIVMFVLGLSLAGNVYQYHQSERIRHEVSTAQLMTYSPPMTSLVVTNGTGTQSTLYSTFENGQWKSYATTTPLSDADIAKIQASFATHERAMHDYFRAQDEWMRHMDEMLWW
jgi:hypothetical protein